MSRINAVRLINVNYNNNAIRISDECFHFNGESTLLSLRNGGGKSVLVQMMMAPFVHKRYRDAKDRPFEGYFTTNKPSFILVEWVLDQDAGYVLTGMMVRRSQDIGEDSGEALEMVNIVSEYQEPCLQDIHHLPVVEKGKKEITLKNFAACRQLFESYKKDRSIKFFHYDMNNSAQSRQYFEKLMEYQINYKEWETIIKKVNLKESGLSDLFADCKDEKGLVEKWFLDAVESKLNKDQNRMKEFQTIMEKYVGQYKDNQSKIKRRDTIRDFKEEAVRIQERAELYRDTEEQQTAQENLVAHFIAELNRLRDLTQEDQDEVLEKLEELREAIARVEYERLSGEIYSLEEEQNYHVGNRDIIRMEQESLEQEAERIEEKLHLLACAKQQEDTDTEKAELEEVRQKLLVSRQKDVDLEPERNYLGYALKSYYEKELEHNRVRQEENQERCTQTEVRIRVEKEKIAGLEENIRQKSLEQGALKSKTEAYGTQEGVFNSRYGENLVRNILGTYEPGTMEILHKTYEQQLEENARELLRKRKRLESLQENQRKLERDREDMQGVQIRKNLEKDQQEQKREEYKAELEVRKVILKYLNIEEKALFDTEGILKSSDNKMQEIEGIRRNLEKEEDRLQKEYRKLTQGKVLELPEELENALINMGIHVVYGMEWLKKNGYSEKKNRKLVNRLPFLPYALILTERELEKLSQNTEEIYTSFPVPIIVRETLENKELETAGAVVQFPGVSFYVLFNENLLNEEKLQQLVQDKENQLERIGESVEIRKKEYREYFERHEKIKNQKVSRKNFDENEELLKNLEQELEALDGELNRQFQELQALKEDIKTLNDEIRKAERQIDVQKRRMEDFDSLCQAYEIYSQNCAALEKCKKETERLLERQILAKNQLEKLQEEQRTLETERDNLFRTHEHLKENLQSYQRYEAADVPEIKEHWQSENVVEMEARYAAITANISQELQQLESQEQKAVKRYQAAVEQLEHLQKKYRLKKGDWQGIFYSRKEETDQEILLEDRRMKIENKKMLWNEEDKQIAVISQQMEERRKRIQSECGKETPLPKAEILDRDFEARKNKIRYEEKEIRKKSEQLRARLQSYDENLTSLAEYNEFTMEGTVEWEQDFGEMDSRELRNFKGILIRDYNQKIRDKQEAKEQLTRVLNQIVRMDAFQEDFYKKPLEAMLELSGDGAQVLLQLGTTIQSYDSLMEKLEVDISLVEKEKEKIVELMEDYIREVHHNLGTIDHNSTITIRERPVKMLKIQLPEWDENNSLYHIRLQDFVDEITKKGIGIFERNENAQEYLGTRLTTRNLYDTVIGIGNVQIRLYKIEAQREYPITWAEVARNSGGEGFLSAFVILSSLLYYMRKDDTDIFADRNEGKVLVMDNPFAQTNAAHLLKPLMDMAKKTNTQLICLTGLGGESIYNRFDNIYVLNLIAASLRNGMQYLRAEHMRGNEPETMIVSHIEVVEQQELVF